MSSLFEFIRNWINKLFGKVKSEAAPVIAEPVPEVSIAKTPGLNCPVCSHRIIVSIEHLLSGQALECPSCGLELTVDDEKSSAALEALHRLQKGLDEASKIKSKSQI